MPLPQLAERMDRRRGDPSGKIPNTYSTGYFGGIKKITATANRGA